MKMESEKSPPSPSIFTKPIFLLFGVGALLTYNAFLTELNFFDHFLKDLSPGKTIPFLNFALNITFQFIILWKKNLFKLKIQLIIGLVCSIVFLILIPIIVANLKKNSIENILITSFLILIMGFVNALLTSGFYSLASFFPLENLVSLNSGMAIAGILMNIIKYIVLITINPGDDEDDIILCALIFFSISGFILLVCLILLIYEFNTDYYKYYLRTVNNNDTRIKNTKELLCSEKENKNKINENNEQNNIEENKKESTNNVAELNAQLVEIEEDDIEPSSESIQEKKEKSFMEIFKILKDVDLLGMYTYIVTASVYPNAVISQSLYGLEDDYNINTILIIINTCDTIGRYLVIKVKASRKLLYSVVLSRTILLFTILLCYSFQQKDKNINFTGTFLLINIIALAISNGISTSLCFGMAPTLVDDEYKGQAGASVSFFATLGTCTGTILAFLTAEIMKKLD